MHFYSPNRSLALLPALFVSAAVAVSLPTFDLDLSSRSAAASDSSAILESLQIGTSIHRYGIPLLHADMSG